MSLSLEEQEVLIRFNRAGESAVVMVPANGFKRWLDRLGQGDPTPREIELDGEVVAYEFTVPKSWIKAPGPKKQVSDEQREAAATRMREARAVGA